MYDSQSVTCPIYKPQHDPAVISDSTVPHTCHTMCLTDRLSLSTDSHTPGPAATRTDHTIHKITQPRDPLELGSAGAAWARSHRRCGRIDQEVAHALDRDLVAVAWHRRAAARHELILAWPLRPRRFSCLACSLCRCLRRFALCLGSGLCLIVRSVSLPVRPFEPGSQPFRPHRLGRVRRLSLAPEQPPPVRTYWLRKMPCYWLRSKPQ